MLCQSRSNVTANLCLRINTHTRTRCEKKYRDYHYRSFILKSKLIYIGSPFQICLFGPYTMREPFFPVLKDGCISFSRNCFVRCLHICFNFALQSRCPLNVFFLREKRKKLTEVCYGSKCIRPELWSSDTWLLGHTGEFASNARDNIEESLCSRFPGLEKNNSRIVYNRKSLLWKGIFLYKLI